MASIQRRKWHSLLGIALLLAMSCGEQQSGSVDPSASSTQPGAESTAPPAPKKATWSPGFGKEPLGYINPQPERLVRGAKWQLSGWAVDDKDGAPVKSVIIMVDDQLAARATLGFPRPDVADTLGRPEMRRSGWIAAIDTSALGVGRHNYKAVAEDSEGNQVNLTASKPPLTIEIVGK